MARAVNQEPRSSRAGPLRRGGAWIRREPAPPCGEACPAEPDPTRSLRPFLGPSRPATPLPLPQPRTAAVAAPAPPAVTSPPLTE